MTPLIYMPRGAGPCAKRVVTATLVTPIGSQVQSTNFCFNPQESCPRDAAGYGPGDGYHLCDEICAQPAHAEVNACKAATSMLDESIKGSTIYVDYTWICDACKATALASGVSNVVLGNPPEVTREC